VKRILKLIFPKKENNIIEKDIVDINSNEYKEYLEYIENISVEKFKEEELKNNYN